MSLADTAFKAGYSGMLLSQYLSGIRDKDRSIAVKHFTRGVLAAKKESKNETKRTS